MDNKKIFADNLKNIMDKTGVTRYDLCDALDFKYSTVSEWLQGSKYPRIDKIEEIAEYFGVKKSELIEDKKRRSPHEINDVDLKYALFGDAEADDELLDDIKKIAKIHKQLRLEERTPKKRL